VPLNQVQGVLGQIECELHLSPKSTLNSTSVSSFLTSPVTSSSSGSVGKESLQDWFLRQAALQHCGDSAADLFWVRACNSLLQTRAEEGDDGTIFGGTPLLVRTFLAMEQSGFNVF